jgi:hypothetical protein
MPSGLVGFDVSAGNAFVDIAANDCRGGTLGTFLLGTPAAGRVQDCSTGNTSYYGTHIFTGSADQFTGNLVTHNNSADAENDIDMRAGSAADQNTAIRFRDKAGTIQQTIRKNNSNQLEAVDSGSVTRLLIANAGGTILNSGNAVSRVTINGSANSGTAGFGVASGGASPANVFLIDGTGAVTSMKGTTTSPLARVITSDFTTSSATLVTITGLSWTVPATAQNFSFHCALSYSQATAAVANSFGIQAATNAPTNIFATAHEQITVGPPATFVDGVLATLSTTTATVIGPTFTPGATATNYVAYLDGTIENPASANTFNIMVLTGNASDAISVKRGSYCQLF